MRLAHLSDLHFGRHDPKAARALLADLRAYAPDLVVISGDFTQDGTKTEFQEAQAFLRSLDLPTFCVPGNHDVPARNIVRRLLAPYDLYRRFISPDLEPFVEMKGLAIAGLKTSRRWRAEWNWAHGSLSRQQLADLAARFAASDPAAVRVVVAHHPLMLPDTPFAMRVVKRADEALEAFSALGVRLVLSGHFHLSYRREHRAERENEGAQDEGFSPNPGSLATNGSLVALQAASAISMRLRGEPNAYNRIELSDHAFGIDVHEWDGSKWAGTRARPAAPLRSPGDMHDDG